MHGTPATVEFSGGKIGLELAEPKKTLRIGWSSLILKDFANKSFVRKDLAHSPALTVIIYLAQ